MSNTLLTIDMVTREALRLAHEKLTFIGTVNRSYDDSFAKGGAKIGDTLRIRQPNAYTRRKGSRVMDVQDQSELNTSVTVATQDGVDMRFNSAELALTIDDFSQRYLEPAMAVLVSGIEGDMLSSVTKDVYNLVGTAGTAVGNSGDISALGKARAKLNQSLAPKDSNRALQLDSVTMASCSDAIKGLFQPGQQISDTFKEGQIGRSAMADFYENERTYTHSTGSDLTGGSDGSAGVTNGGNTINMGNVTVNKGDIFTLPNVYMCHYETKASQGVLQQFVVVSSAAGVVTVSPAIYISGARQNVCKSDGTALATTDFNSQTATFVGSASTAYRHNLMYHKDAFTFVTADLPLMDDALKCVRRQQDGLSLRVWQASDIRNDEMLVRLDILYGFKTIRPEWACRLTN